MWNGNIVLASIFAIILFSVMSTALPEVVFPFNSQVPTVARVGQAYNFQFADTTFQTDGNGNLTYILVDPPAWLNLDSATRTLYGTPGQGNSGPNTFSIASTDTLGSTKMTCTLVVADIAAPQVTGNISVLLAASGTLSGPASLLLQPSSAFSIAFGEDVFQDNSGRIQAYYATLSDHTPLPSWLQFEESAVGFWGIVPAATTETQEFAVDLIASDVIGFGGAVITFTLVISSKNLAFEPQQESLDVVAGTPFEYKSLMSQLFLNGKAVQSSQIQSASAQVPGWLIFDNETLDLTGTPPPPLRTENVQINVTDKFGDTAMKSIYLHADNSSLFTRDIGNLTATAGQLFVYTIQPSLFSQFSLNTSVDTGAAASWLSFDQTALQLRGTPPTSTETSTTVATIIASSSALSRSESQTFSIQIKAAAVGTGIASSSRLTSRTSPTNRSTATALGAPSSQSSGKSDSAGIIVGAIIGGLALFALFFAVGMLLYHHRRRREPSRSPGKLKISRPLASDNDWMPTEISIEANDLEKAASAPSTGGADRAPHLSLNQIPTSISAPQPNKRVSTASSIGDAGGLLLADSNIPVWGRKSRASHTPHDSYSAATELARRHSQSAALRLSAPTRLSPSKRGSRILRSWQSSHSAGLSTDMHGTVVRRPTRRSRMSGGLSLSRNPSSNMSLNTRGTSPLSFRTSDFPVPLHLENRNSRSIPTVSLTGADKRRSIRLVSRSDSSNVDTRPLAEKRQSFIRNRASSSIISPLFASSRRSSNLNEANLDSASGSLKLSQSLRRDRSDRTTFSTSSSLEPPTRNPRRLASSSAVFGSNFPRAITPSAVHDQQSPTLPVIPPRTEGDSDLYTTTTGTTSSSSRRHSGTASTSASAADAAANEELRAALALPRQQRNFVLPGEASPTPPPSSATRNYFARDQARRKWADRLHRDSRGGYVSRSPSPVRINLRTTAVEIGTGKENEEGSKGSLKNAQVQKGRDRLTDLVSNDSLSFGMRKRGVRHAGGRVASIESGSRSFRAVRKDVVEAQSGGGAAAEEVEDPEWEDVGSVVESGVGFGIGIGIGIPEGENETPLSTLSGRAFI